MHLNRNYHESLTLIMCAYVVIYSFNYQNAIIFDPPKVILPGDTLILDFYFDSSSRDFVTYGGESTREEMCFDFFLYYPAVDLISASSAKNYIALGQWMADAQTNGYLTGDILSAFNLES